MVSPHARIAFDTNRYSVPPHLRRQTVTVRADGQHVRIVHQGQVVAQHVRCYERRQRIVLPDHRLAALTMSRRSKARRWNRRSMPWVRRHASSTCASRASR